jgi:hypothetical protein
MFSFITNFYFEMEFKITDNKNTIIKLINSSFKRLAADGRKLPEIVEIMLLLHKSSSQHSTISS